jgi:hypothetical protein
MVDGIGSAEVVAELGSFLAAPFGSSPAATILPS